MGDIAITATVDARLLLCHAFDHVAPVGRTIAFGSAALKAARTKATEHAVWGGWVPAVEADRRHASSGVERDIGPIESTRFIVSAGGSRGQAPCCRRAVRRATRAHVRYRPSWIDFLGYPGYLVSAPV